MGMEILGLLGLSSVFGLIGLVLAGWMAWRIVEKRACRAGRVSAPSC